MHPQKPHFIGKPAPVGYVAGISRGARAFTTEASVGRVIEEKVDQEALNDFEQLEKKAKKRYGKRKRQENVAETESGLKPKLNVKDTLVGMTMDDWLSIPESKNISKRKKQKKSNIDVYVPPSTTVLNSGLSVLSKEANNDFMELLNLATKNAKNADIGSLRRARDTLNSAVKANSANSQSWISLAKVEESSNEISQARHVILQGCEACPEDQEVWLEAVRLHPATAAKAILGQAVRFIPNSEAIWLKAAELEQNTKDKQQVIERALEIIPNSEGLHKSLIDLEEDPQRAIPLLKKAIKKIPNGVDFFLALSSLLPIDESTALLKQALKLKTQTKLIWTKLTYLQENNSLKLQSTIKNMLETLDIDRKTLINMAISAESNGHLNCAIALVENITEITSEEAELCSDAPNLCRFMFSRVFEKPSVELYQKQIERLSSNKEILPFLINISKSIDSTILWLKHAKSQNSHKEALNVLLTALDHTSNIELYISVCKIYCLLHEFEKGLEIADKGTKIFNLPRMHLKKATVLRHINLEVCTAYLKQMVNIFPNFYKFRLFLAQCVPSEAILILNNGLKCISSIDLLYAAVSVAYERVNKLARSRAALERGRKNCPKSELLWVKSSQLEMRHNSRSVAISVLLKGLSAFPSSGLLWSELIFTEIPEKRKGIVIEASKRCPDDGFVACSVAVYYWTLGEMEKANHWFEHSIKLNPLNGDAFIHYYAFQKAYGSTQKVLELVRTCEPKYGELYASFNKNWKNWSIEELLEHSVSFVNPGLPWLHKNLLE